MMKKNLRFILLSFIIIPLISGCTSELGYYEDKLYSEKAFTDYKAELTVDQNSNILTREKAVEKVIGVFKEGLNKKIDRAAFSESIKLYRDSSDTAFKWQINWTDPSTKESYISVVDSSNGDILSIIITNHVTEGEQNYSGNSSDLKSFFTKVDKAEVLSIITPLTTALKININPDNTILEPVWATDTKDTSRIDSNKTRSLYNKDLVNVILLFSDTSKKYYSILIDYKNKKILSYSSDKSILKY